MVTDDNFRALMDRVRDGDEQAAAELVRLHETEVRRFIRFRLNSASLRRIFDSLDIWQSVLAKFFVHLDAGQLDLQEPVQLRKLLMTMARNKLCDQIRGQRADRRDVRRVKGWTPDMLDTLAGQQETPSQIVARNELLTEIQDNLAEDDHDLFQQRAAGRSWAELAEERNSQPDALRKRMTRALDRVAEKLGFIESQHE